MDLFKELGRCLDPFENSLETWYCEDCHQECTPVEESFDYAGTHCTGGRSGTHHTGHYLSSCCGAEIVEESDRGHWEHIDDLTPEWQEWCKENGHKTLSADDLLHDLLAQKEKLDAHIAFTQSFIERWDRAIDDDRNQ